jgi:mevalonate pyrophosphate decarboxylase
VKEIIRMREEGISAWYSMDTGPSVFVNTYKKDSDIVAHRLRTIGFMKVIVSGVGEQATITTQHLF